MSDQPDPFDRLDDEEEQQLESYEVNDGVVGNLVDQAREIIGNDDYHNNYPDVGGGHVHGGLSPEPTKPESILEDISIPSEDISSLALSEVLIRISNIKYQDGGQTPQLKGNVSSALLMKLDEAYPKHWDIRLGGQRFDYLFRELKGLQSLRIENFAGKHIGENMDSVDYICMKNINGSLGYIKGGTVVFKNIPKLGGPPTQRIEAESVVFLNGEISQFARMTRIGNVILKDVSISGSGPGPMDSNRPLTAFTRQGFTTIFYYPSGRIDVPEDAGERVRPLTDEEYRLIADLADGPPPDKDEVEDVVACLAEGVDSDE